MSEYNFQTWFKPIKPLKLENNVLTLGIPSLFYYDWLEEHYVDLINKVIKNQIGPDVKLEYNVLIDSKTEESIGILSTNAGQAQNQRPGIDLKPISLSENVLSPPVVQPEAVHSNLNPKYSFDTFVEGPCNRLARAAGLAIAAKPGGTAFNPLVIHSAPGLGKTHLSQAIGLEAKKINPALQVIYVPAEVFGQQFVRALYSSKINDFVSFYQRFDMLIVDDIQFFSGTSKIQDTFFSIFNYLHTGSKQIILTSDQAPKDLVGLEERLLSRFKWGLSAPLVAPDLQTKIGILKAKLKAEGILLSDEVIDYVACSVNGNVRELEGVVISLIAHATFNSKEPDLELAKEVISSTIRDTPQQVPSLDYIQTLVCNYFDLNVDQLKAKTRRREVVQARQISMYLAKKYTGSSLKKIGMFYGGKDHSTVIYACNTINNLIEADKNIKAWVADLEVQLAS